VLNDTNKNIMRWKTVISVQDLDTGRLRYQRGMNINTKLGILAKPGYTGTTTAINVT